MRIANSRITHSACPIYLIDAAITLFMRTFCDVTVCVIIRYLAFWTPEIVKRVIKTFIRRT